MTLTRLPSGRWRARVWHDEGWISVPSVIGGERSYRTRKEAGRAKARAAEVLEASGHSRVTVGEFHKRWTTDPLFNRPSESTNMWRAERTKAFAEKYRDLPLAHVGDLVVAQWLAGGKRNSTVPALRLMFGDASKPIAGRLVKTNPFAGLGLESSKGNKEKSPPSEEQAWTLIGLARELTPPSFADYLEVACFSAGRPGELDALVDDDVDFETDEIEIRRQWNAKTGKFTLPKHRHVHTITLTPIARACLQRRVTAIAEPEHIHAADPGVHDFVGAWCFPTLRDTHYTPSARTHHWNRVRAAAGLGDVTLYLATRHFAGSYMLNVLGLPPHVIAEQLGHRDGGKLVVQLYGHPDAGVARRKIHDAYSRTGQVKPLRVVKKESA